jgi:hypothetical protein
MLLQLIFDTTIGVLVPSAPSVAAAASLALPHSLALLRENSAVGRVLGPKGAIIQQLRTESGVHALRIEKDTLVSVVPPPACCEGR